MIAATFTPVEQIAGAAMKRFPCWGYSKPLPNDTSIPALVGHGHAGKESKQATGHKLATLGGQ